MKLSSFTFRPFHRTLVLALFVCLAGAQGAALTPAQRKEVAEIRQSLSKAAGLIAKQELEEGGKLLDEAETKLKALVKAADLDEKDKAVAPTFALLAAKRKLLEKKEDAAPESEPAASALPHNLTVSFVKDIAPFMVSLCLGCHGDKKREGGLSLTSFESLMKGGQSGAVVLRDNWEESRLWKLVGEQDPIKMPQGQARITRKNWNDLRTWLEEGAHFDGSNPKAPLRGLVPSEEERRSAELAKIPADELAQRRKAKALADWKKANPRTEFTQVETDEVLLLGDVGESRLKEIGSWSDKQIELLRETFGVKSVPLIKGRLTVFVYKGRFEFEEFPRTIESRELPPEICGYARVTPNLDTAYVCLQDVGDDASDSAPGLRASLIDHLSAAYLQSGAKALPEWLVRGAGLALAARADKKNQYLVALRGRAAQATKGLTKPTEVFAKGTFSPGDLGAVGYTLVNHLLHFGGWPRLVRLIEKLQSGSALNQALLVVYNNSEGEIAESYLLSLGAAGTKSAPRKKK